jgi:hypothetical protein
MEMNLIEKHINDFDYPYNLEQFYELYTFIECNDHEIFKFMIEYESISTFDRDILFSLINKHFGEQSSRTLVEIHRLYISKDIAHSQQWIDINRNDDYDDSYGCPWATLFAWKIYQMINN